LNFAVATQYEFRVRAENSVGKGVWSPFSASDNGEGYTGRYPAAATGMAVSSGSGLAPIHIVATWNAATDYGLTIFNYEVEVREVATPSNTEVISMLGTVESPWDIGSLPLTINAISFSTLNFAVATQYEFRVRAENSLGKGVWSAFSASANGVGYTLSQPSQAPANLRISSNTLVSGTQTRLGIDWDPAATDAEKGYETPDSNLVYELQGMLNGGGGSFSEISTVTGSACHTGNTAGCTIDHTGPEQTEVWDYQVRVLNRGPTDGAWSATLSYTVV